jgi:hypothetical protein
MLAREEPEVWSTHKGFASAKDRHAAAIVIPFRKAMMAIVCRGYSSVKKSTCKREWRAEGGKEA